MVLSVVPRVLSLSHVGRHRWPEAKGLYGVMAIPNWRQTGSISRSSSIVRVAMMPGTAQAKLDSSGMKARPDSPTEAIMRSIRNAARTM